MKNTGLTRARRRLVRYERQDARSARDPRQGHFFFFFQTHEKLVQHQVNVRVSDSEPASVPAALLLRLVIDLSRLLGRARVLARARAHDVRGELGES